MSHKQIAKKLLSTEAGRKALSELMGGAQIVSQGESDRPVVATLTPCYKYPEPEMTEAYVNMSDFSRKNGIAIYNGSTIRNSSVVHWSRNQLIANLIKSKKPWTHVLFIDDDIVCQPDSVVKLLSHGKDIVGGVCTRRQDPPIPNIRWWEEETGNFREIYDWGADGLLEVGAVGTGLMLISRNALEQVAEVYFRCMFEKEVFGMSDERIKLIKEQRLKRFDDTADAWWFRFLPHVKNATAEYGEDIAFCLCAKRYAEIQVYADTTVRPGHLGQYPYSIADFLPFRDDVIARAKAEGRYTDPKAEEILVTA